MNFEILTKSTSKYPLNLQAIEDYGIIPQERYRIDNPVVERKEAPLPHKIYQVGDFSNTPQTSHLAVVGSREMPKGSKENIENFLPELFVMFLQMYPHASLSVVSGLTSGGDAIAHWTTLSRMSEEDRLHALGITATSINHVHEQGDQALYKALLSVDQAGVISEHEPQKDAIRPQYYDRNRLTAWLAGATLLYGITRTTSGAMHAMSLARWLSKPVFYLEGTTSKSVAAELDKRGCVGLESPEEFINYFLDLRK